MKFIEAHRNDILDCFEALDLSKDGFFFRKKKGRIFVEHNESKLWFSYLFKDLSYIDLITKKRVETGSWEIKTTADEAIIVENWSIVLEQLRSWLKQSFL